MRQFTPPLQFVHPRQTALFGGLGVSVEGSKARSPGDNEYSDFNTVGLPTVQLDPYGPGTYFEVFCTGRENTTWELAMEPFITINTTEGALCPSCQDTGDQRVYISIDWDLAPTGHGSTLVNFTVNHSGGEPSQHSDPPMIEVFYNHTFLPSNFTAGFVESQGHISMEAEHFTRQVKGTGGQEYTLLPGYGRTLSAVSLSNHTQERLTTETAPTLEYDFFKFSNESGVFNVSMIMGTGLNNYPGSPLTYAVQFDDIDEPVEISYIGEAPPGRGARPDGWDASVFDAAWVNTTMWENELGPGKHTLKVWLLQPGTVLTKIMLNFGGQRPSYLGPPESMLLK